jgi:hypothetical protein
MGKNRSPTVGRRARPCLKIRYFKSEQQTDAANRSPGDFGCDEEMGLGYYDLPAVGELVVQIVSHHCIMTVRCVRYFA